MSKQVGYGELKQVKWKRESPAPGKDTKTTSSAT